MADLNSVSEITAKLEDGIKEIFESEKYANYLKTMSRFHRYSARNIMLIHMQKPDATRVAGYAAWKDKFKRQVKLDEKDKGIKILAPVKQKIRKSIEVIDPVTKKPVIDENGKTLQEEKEIKSARFLAVDVYDVSQTTGEPLPVLTETITGDVEQYDLFIDTLNDLSPLPILFDNLPDDTDGICTFEKNITIRTGMSEIQTVSAVIHEIAHAKLHDNETLQLIDETAQILSTKNNAVYHVRSVNRDEDDYEPIDEYCGITDVYDAIKGAKESVKENKVVEIECELMPFLSNGKIDWNSEPYH